MNITRVGVDIAKTVFHAHAVDRHGSLVWQAKLKRNQWLTALSHRLASGDSGPAPASGSGVNPI